MIKKIKLFGFNIWISREPLKIVHKDRKRNSYRSSQRNLRLEMTENRCEVCGKPIDKSCHIHRTLPVGAPDRNSVENIRVLCSECWHELERKPHIHGYQHMEDNTRYDTENGGNVITN